MRTGTDAIPAGHVQALGDPVEAGGTGRDREPRQRVLLDVGVQPGDEADREEDAERGAEDGGQALVAQRRAVGALVEGRVGVGGQALQRLRQPHAHAESREPAAGGRGRQRGDLEARSAGQAGDGVGADDGPGEGLAAPAVALEPGGEPAPASPGRLDLGDHRALAADDLPATLEKPGRVAADADVAVEQEGGAPAALARQRTEDVALENGGAAHAGQGDSRRRRVDAQRRDPLRRQADDEAARPQPRSMTGPSTVSSRSASSSEAGSCQRPRSSSRVSPVWARRTTVASG